MAIETPTMVVTCDFCPETIEVDLTENYAVSGPVTLFDSTASERKLADDGWALHFGPADEVKCESCATDTPDKHYLHSGFSASITSSYSRRLTTTRPS